MAPAFKSTSGARIGWVNVSWPLAELSVTPRSLVIRAWLIGTYTFTPEQVIRIEPYGSIPILYRGIRIVHSNPDCPSNVIFWCLRNPERLIERIRQARFIPSGSPQPVEPRRGMPFRWSFVLALVVVWNALFILDGFVPGQVPSKPPGVFVLLGLALVFLATVAMERSPVLQRWALKPGRSVGEVRPVLRLVRLVTGFIVVILFIVLMVA